MTFNEASPILVSPRVAALVRTFVERACCCDHSEHLPRNPERGRVVALAEPDLDIMIRAQEARSCLVGLAMAALDRRRPQIVFRVPVLGPKSDLTIDLALWHPAGSMIASGNQLWRRDSSFWIVPRTSRFGRCFKLDENGCFEVFEAPWIDDQDKARGLRSARRAVEVALGTASPTSSRPEEPGSPVYPFPTSRHELGLTADRIWPYPSGSSALYTATLVEPMGRFDRMFFAAFMCEREGDAYPKLARRIGLVSADRAAIRVGVDRHDPITAILVSSPMYEALDDAVANPAAAARDGLDLLIERRFTALRAASIRRADRTGLSR